MATLYMGFDFSTQQLKVTVINSKLEKAYEEAVRFDDLKEYKTVGGCHVQSDGLTVTAPTIMWVEALDILLDRLREQEFPFSQVQAISGAGQQHGSVYWKCGSESKLESLNPDETLRSQLADSFAVSQSPIWMDSSTTRQCKELEDAVGGAQMMADISGSRAYERFTGTQILKIIQDDQDSYKKTERISLVSSFAASLFKGGYCSIDESDGSGMNLLNIKTRKWEETLTKACGDDLASKLGDVAPTITVQGNVSPYFVKRYGFNDNCQVVCFTGDNPASLAGLRQDRGDVAISLGTSDTVFLWLNEPSPKTEGHIFVNPIVSEDYMALLCFKNGSLTREHVCNLCAGGDWTMFDKLLAEQPAGNHGYVGLYYTMCEIIPSNIEGCFFFNKDDEAIDSLPSPAAQVRAVVEGQFLSRRIHAEDIGFKIGPNTRILATGGASSNRAMLQILSDVFNTPVYTQEVANSASLGGAYLALHATSVLKDNQSFQDRLKGAAEFQLAVTPQSENKSIYDVMAARYRNLEKKVVDLKSSRS